MPYIPYQDAPVRLLKTAPRILQYFQSPKGLLAVNLARCEYRNALANGLGDHEALICADAELDTIGLGARVDVGEWISGRVSPPVALIAANDVDIYSDAKHLTIVVAA